MINKLIATLTVVQFGIFLSKLWALFSEMGEVPDI
jgi:hypothetical protein